MKIQIFLLLTLISTSLSLHIRCNFNFNSNWVVIGRVYTCDATIIDITSNGTTYEGEHLPGNSSADVRMIDFGVNSNCSQLSSIPSGFSSIFSNFNAIYFIGCGINFLNGSELDEYPQLEWFGLYRSQLERIPGNFFGQTRNLRFVNFNSNQITRVGKYLLDDLENLERVYFNNNVCVNKYATNSTGIQELIQVLRDDCYDSDMTTVSYKTTTSDWCERGNSEERICLIEEENLSLRAKVEDLEARLRRLEDIVIFYTTTPVTTTASASP